MAALVWFPLTSTTQDPKMASLEKAPKELAGIRFDAKVEFPEKAPSAKLVIETSNPGGATIKKTFKIFLMETKIQAEARMMPTPKAVWEKEITVELEAGKDGKFSFLDEKFNSWNKKEDTGEEWTRTLREVVAVCGDERVTLLSNAPKFSDIK
jgi:hypothetical protein